ncbi:MAG: hypothetical protein L6Q66_10860 [Bacteroidia bacterium]|nr:hypothetical protein [Bacteroidia bacterium]
MTVFVLPNSELEIREKIDSFKRNFIVFLNDKIEKKEINIKKENIIEYMPQGYLPINGVWGFQISSKLDQLLSKENFDELNRIWESS